MDLLERAGLAGLYMALRAASEAKVDLSPLTWTDADLTPDSVTVRWAGPAKPAFEKLMKWAWQVKDGVLYLPTVQDIRDRAQWWLRVPMHNGIFNTFLQHDNTLAQEKRSPTLTIPAPPGQPSAETSWTYVLPKDEARPHWGGPCLTR